MMTNRDKLRAMSDEELAEILQIVFDDDVCFQPSESCDTCVFKAFCDVDNALEWLKQEATDD